MLDSFTPEVLGDVITASIVTQVLEVRGTHRCGWRRNTLTP